MALFLTPWLSFAIMRGGVGQLVHLANSINAPAQSAAAQAANEQVSGSIALGSISYGNQSFSKRSGTNWNDTATLNQDLTISSKGIHSTSVDNKGNVVEKQDQSHLPVNTTVTLPNPLKEVGF